MANPLRLAARMLTGPPTPSSASTPWSQEAQP